jgi:hypothetical protein
MVRAFQLVSNDDRPVCSDFTRDDIALEIADWPLHLF